MCIYFLNVINLIPTFAVVSSILIFTVWNIETIWKRSKDRATIRFIKDFEMVFECVGFSHLQMYHLGISSWNRFMILSNLAAFQLQTFRSY